MTTTPGLYVQELNNAEAGPFTLPEAIAHARKCLCIPARDASSMTGSYEAGDPGPWHFSYGFHSVTIRRDSEVRPHSPDRA